MAVTPILAIQLIAPTQTDKTTTMNDAIAQLEAATNDQLNIDMSAGAVTLSTFQFTRFVAYVITGLTADHVLTVPLIKRLVSFRNDTDFILTVGGATGLTIDIPARSGVIMHCDGVDCFLFGVGGPGPTGATGPAGGAINIDYVFITSTTNADPGGGNIALSNATQNLSTAIYADIDDSEGVDWTAVLDTLDASSSTVKGQIRLFVRADPTKWILFNLTARVSHTGYREFTVAPIGSSAASPFTAADDLSLSFVRTGDIGLIGPIGLTGTFGAVGAGKLVGNSTTVAAVPNDVTVGAGLTFVGGTLVATASATPAGAGKLVGNASTVTAVAGDITVGPGLSLSAAGTLDITAVPLPPGEFIANTTTGTAVGIATSLSTLLDDVIAATQGAIIVRDTAWSSVAAGTPGQVLVTQGTTALPGWHTMAIGDLAPINAGKLVGNGGTAAAAPAELTVGVGLTLNAGTLTSTALGEALFFAGTWNATSNTPTLTSGAGTPGAMYTVTTAGTTAIDGISAWNVGDKIAFDGVANVWRKIDGIANEVISVAGRTGAVTLVSADVTDLQWNGGTVTSLDGGLNLTTGTLSANWNAGTVTAIDGSLNLTTGTLSANWNAGTVTAIDSSLALTAGTLGADWNGGVVSAIGPNTSINSGTIDIIQIPTLTGINATTLSFSITGLAQTGTLNGGTTNLTAGTSGTGATGNGGLAQLKGGAALSTNGSGGQANVIAGAGSGTGAGGAAALTGGTTTGTGAGGVAAVTGGAPVAGSTATGGQAQVIGGASGTGATGTGGTALLRGGASVATDGAGGATTVQGGVGKGTGAGGLVQVLGGAGDGTGTGTGTGGAVNIIGGSSAAGTIGAGGSTLLRGGAAISTNGAGGSTVVQGGVGTGTGNGGLVNIVGGASGTGATGAGGSITQTGGAALSTNGAGGNSTLVGGAGSGTGLGGTASVTGGAAATGGTGNGGLAQLKAGASGTGATGAGGAANVIGGAALSTNGAGGTTTIQGGAGSGTGNGGDVALTPGAKGTTGAVGTIRANGTVVVTGDINLGTSTGPTVTQGTGLPVAVYPNGSIYLRNDGTIGARVYESNGATWEAISSPELPLGFILPGKPATGQVYNLVIGAPCTIPASLAGSKVYDTTQATANAAFVVNKITGGSTITPIGTVTVTPTSHISATLTGNQDYLSAGDVLQLVAPTQDATLADLGITILANRGTPTFPLLDIDFTTGVLDPRLTFTRASGATYFDVSGVMQLATSGTPRFDFDPVTHVARGLMREEARTNTVRNSTMVGAVAGTPGTMPTNWINAVGSGITTSVIGTGTDANGLTYIDVRWAGTTVGAVNNNLTFESTTAASNGQVWNGSAYVSLVGGSLANVGNISLKTSEQPGGAQVVLGSLLTPTGAALVTQRVGGSATMVTVGTTSVLFFMTVSVGAGAVIDLTLRIACPQFELVPAADVGVFGTSFIPTTTAAATRVIETVTLAIGSWYNQSIVSVAFDWVYNGGGTTFFSPMNFVGSNQATDNIGLFAAAAGPVAAGPVVKVANVTSTSGTAFTAIPLPTGTIRKMAFTVSAGGRSAGGIDGVSYDVGRTVTVLPAVISGILMGFANSQSGPSGYMRRLRYWGRNLSNAELAQVTT